MSKLISGKYYWAESNKSFVDLAQIHGPFDNRGDAYHDALHDLFFPVKQMRFPWNNEVSFCTGTLTKESFGPHNSGLFDVISDQMITHIATQEEALRS